MLGRLFYLLLIVAWTAGRAGTPHLTLDINTHRVARSSDPTYLGKLGNSIYFIAHDVPGGSNAALFKIDGSGGGTTKVKDIGPGPGVSANYGLYRPPYEKPTLFIAAGTKAYFLAWQETTGQEVWVTDGTEAGTHLVADVYPGPSGPPGALLLGLVGTDLLFASNTSEKTWQIFRTDGTSAGTVALTNFPASSYGLVNEVLAINGKVYLSMDQMNICCHPDLWVTDGTTLGTHQIGASSQYHVQPSSFAVFGNFVLFTGTDPDNGSNVLYRLDPSSDTLQMLGAAQFNSSYQSSIAVMNGFAFFVGRDSTLWKTDGTLAGTTRVKDIALTPMAGRLGSQDTQLLRAGDRVIFQGDDGVHGAFIWSSDGTDQGTVPLISAHQYANLGPQSMLATVGTHAYFGVTYSQSAVGNSNWQLAVTDGTPAGTHVLSDIGFIDVNDYGINTFAGDDTLTFIHVFDNTNGFGSQLFAYAPQTNTLTGLSKSSQYVGNERPLLDNGHFYFDAFDALTGGEPWISDGTVAGTHLIQNVNPESLTDDSNPHSFVDLGDRLAFLANDGTNTLIWVSDGTTTGTKRVSGVSPANGISEPVALSAMNGSLYFFAYDSTSTSQLMRVDSPDGVPQAIAPLTPMYPPEPYYTPPCTDQRTAVLNNNLYFTAAHGAGYELFKTDGTAAGTAALTNLSSSSFSFIPCSLSVEGGRVYFTGSTPNGPQLWTTDGTSAGTVQLSNVAYLFTAPTPTSTVLNGQFYFASLDPSNVSHLWKTDGTAAGTVMTASFASDNGSFSSVWPIGTLNGKLLLEALVGTSQPQLWLSDGTQAGTTPLNTPPLSQIADVTVIGSKAYFPVQVTPTSSVPWVTDGTQQGTSKLADTNAQQSTNPLWFQDFRGQVIFEVLDSTGASQLYRTDGTTAGTVAIGAIGAAPTPLLPGNRRPRLASGQNFFLSAVDPNAGVELFAMPNNPPVTAAASATSDAGAPVTINVLTNDTDSDGTIDPSNIKIVTNPAHGTVTVNADGSITYTPTAGYAGQDTFAYTVADNQGAVSAPASVTVDVKAAVTVTPPPQNSGSGGGSNGGSGGGGGVGYLDIAVLLALIGLRGAHLRRRHIQ